MNKKYIVRLSDDERSVCHDIVKRLKGSSEKVKQAQILLKADADELRWSDSKIAEAYGCSVQTVENLRERLVTAGFDTALERKKRADTAAAAQARWRGRSKADRNAVGEAAGGV